MRAGKGQDPTTGMPRCKNFFLVHIRPGEEIVYPKRR